jgi:hypothetical protein
MSFPHSLEDTIGAAAKGGWDWFDHIEDEKIRDRVKLELAKKNEDAQTIASAWAAFSLSPGGRLALEALFDTTLRRNVYFVNLGQDAQAMAMWGAFREGQNALAQAIAKQIAVGLGLDEQPKPRDVE